MSFSLAGKSILITGGSRGIGAEITKAAATQGAKLLIIGYVSSKKGADELIASLKANKETSTTDIIAVQGNLTDQESCSAFVKEALTKTPDGKFDALICSAGVMDMVPLAASSDANFDKHFDINVKGPLFTIQALLPNLTNDGRIVLFSSSVTTHPMAIQPGYLQYAMTKGAVEQMVRVLARDPSIGGPERRITVNAIAPGATGTELFYESKSPEMIARISSLMPQNRIGQPEEIADATISLLMPAARWIHGQTIRVNGAQSL